MKQTVMLDINYNNIDHCNISYKDQEYSFKNSVVKYSEDLLLDNGYNVLKADPKNKFNPNDKVDIYINIDTGYSRNNNVRGFWVFYWYDCLRSKQLAKSWNNFAQHHFQHPSKGIRASRPGEWTDFKHIRKPNQLSIPTILIKHGYLTNENDFNLLRSDQFRVDCAKVLLLTVKQFFKDNTNDIDWRLSLGEKALSYLEEQGLLANKDKFSNDLLSPLPAWVIWEMFKRMAER